MKASFDSGTPRRVSIGRLVRLPNVAGPSSPGAQPLVTSVVAVAKAAACHPIRPDEIATPVIGRRFVRLAGKHGMSHGDLPGGPELVAIELPAGVFRFSIGPTWPRPSHACRPRTDQRVCETPGREARGGRSRPDIRSCRRRCGPRCAADAGIRPGVRSFSGLCQLHRLRTGQAVSCRSAASPSAMCHSQGTVNCRIIGK